MKSRAERDELFMKYIPLIRSTASRFWKKYKKKIMSYEDLYQTICYLFLYAYELWDPERGKFGPHLKNVLEYKLKAMMKGEKAPRSKEYPFSFLKPKYTLKEEVG